MAAFSLSDGAIESFGDSETNRPMTRFPNHSISRVAQQHHVRIGMPPHQRQLLSIK
jgi:hypothetical protein